MAVRVGGTGQAGVTAQISERLHDLCQPLTALQCRLEIAQMQANAQARVQGEVVEWVSDCLRECERMNVLVTAMKELVMQERRDK